MSKKINFEQVVSKYKLDDFENAHLLREFREEQLLGYYSDVITGLTAILAYEKRAKESQLEKKEGQKEKEARPIFESSDVREVLFDLERIKKEREEFDKTLDALRIHGLTLREPEAKAQIAILVYQLKLAVDDFLISDKSSDKIDNLKKTADEALWNNILFKKFFNRKEIRQGRINTF